MTPPRALLAALAILTLFASSSTAFFSAATARPVGSIARKAGIWPALNVYQSNVSRQPHEHICRQTVGSVRLRMSTDATVEQKGLVTVYHKETCPYCKKALALLEDEYKVIVMRVNVLGEDSDKKIKQMKTFSGRNTVPQIFFNSEHIGGNDDLQTLHEDGKLPELVTKVRAEAPGIMKDNWYHPWY